MLLLLSLSLLLLLLLAAVVVVVLTLTRTIKPVVTGQAPVTLEWRNAPGNNTNKSKSGTRIYHS